MYIYACILYVRRFKLSIFSPSPINLIIMTLLHACKFNTMLWSVCGNKIYYLNLSYLVQRFINNFASHSDLGQFGPDSNLSCG